MAAVVRSEPFARLQGFLQRFVKEQTSSLSPPLRIIFYNLTRDTARCPFSRLLRQKGLRSWLDYAAQQHPVLLLLWGNKFQVGTTPHSIWRPLCRAINKASSSSGGGPVVKVFTPNRRGTRGSQDAQLGGKPVTVLFLGEAPKRYGRFDITTQFQLQRFPAVVVEYRPALRKVGYPLIPRGCGPASTPNVTYVDAMLTQYLSDAVSALATNTASTSPANVTTITASSVASASSKVDHIKNRLFQWWSRTAELEDPRKNGDVQQDAFIEDAKLLAEFASMTVNQHRDTSKQADLYMWLCRAQAALFDVPNIILTDIETALWENNRRITGKNTSKEELLEDLKRKIRLYRLSCPEPVVDLQTGPASCSSSLLKRARAIYYGAMGTSPPQFLTHTIGKQRITISAKHLRLQARLHRMAAARWALRSFFLKKQKLRKPRRTLSASKRRHVAMAFHHALSAYRWEVIAQTSLPTLHHLSLNPPSVHLVAALIGSGYPGRVLNKVLMKVEHTVAPVRLPSRDAIIRKPVIGRARGGKPRLDRGKKRYLWLNPSWKPPWAPRRHWRLEEWSWKF